MKDSSDSSLPKSLVDNEDYFNLARLLVLVDVFDQSERVDGVNVERIGYYDFFASQPLLIFKDEKSVKLDLIYYGFESMTISYSSSSQRFANRREKLKHYMAGLLMRDLIIVKNCQEQIFYSISPKGKEIASEFKSMYIMAYRKSAELVIHKLSRMSDKALTANARTWLKADSFMIDLYDY